MTIEFVPQVEEKLSPIERLEALCDPGSLTLLRSDVRSRRMGEKARAGDGVIAGAGRVDGRPVFCYAQDPSYLGGSLGEQHADSIVRVLRLAGRAGAPVVGFIESGGARMQEGLAALAGYARIFKEHVALSGRIPQISVICGASAGGGSYSPALTDFVVMTERGNMFLTGPAVVKEVMGEDVGAFDLGGPKVHDRNGVAHFVARNDTDAALLVRDLGADYVFAWPQATLGVMGAKQAVGIVKRRDIAAANDPEAARDAYADEYTDEHLTSAVAAAEGYVDEIVPPSDTRRRLTEALRTLEAVAHPAHGVRNIPL
jgi:acetyl-CoA carboxylase carboxyltransferase component